MSFAGWNGVISGFLGCNFQRERLHRRDPRRKMVSQRLAWSRPDQGEKRMNAGPRWHICKHLFTQARQFACILHKQTWLNERTCFFDFRCVLPSLWEGVSVRPSVVPSVSIKEKRGLGASFVGYPALFLHNYIKTVVFDSIWIKREGFLSLNVWISLARRWCWELAENIWVKHFTREVEMKRRKSRRRRRRRSRKEVYRRMSNPSHLLAWKQTNWENKGTSDG